MNSKELKHLMMETFAHLEKLMESKGAEYQGDTEDRLGNFKRGAAGTGVEPLTVLHIYMGKHWDSFTTYVRDGQRGRERYYSESIESRLDDLINYAILAKALIHEKVAASRGKAYVDQGVNGEMEAKKRFDSDKEYQDYQKRLQEGKHDSRA